jgi:hypothetical protein
MKRALSLLPLSLLIACGKPAPEDGTEHPSGFSTNKVCVKTDALPIEPGLEATRCVTAHLPTKDPLSVIQIDIKQSYTHHVIFYRESPEAQDMPTRDCQPLNLFDERYGVVREPLFIGETPEATLRMPKGVAYKMGAGAPYTIEMHYFNPSAKTVQAQAEVCLTPAAPGEAIQPADMFFYTSVRALNKSYDGMARGLPPGKRTTLEPAGFHKPRAGVKIFGLTSHQHRLGVEFTISRALSAQDPGQLLLRNTDWEHPTLLQFPDDQLLTMDEAKGEGLRWTCTYENTNSFYVTFGESAFKNEMCILWGYYFPGRGFDIYFE